MKARAAVAADTFLTVWDRETGKMAGFINGLATDETTLRDEFFKDAVCTICVIGGKILTPSITHGSILPGITRKSVIELLRHWGYEVEETRITVDDLMEAYKEGKFTEMFGTGTAAVISPVGLLRYKDYDMKLSDGKIGELSQKLYDELTGIQWGKRPDPFGWVVPVC